MPTRSHRPRRPKAAQPDVLATIASTIDDAFDHLTSEDPAHLIRVISPSAALEEIELGLLPLEPGVHPAAAMAGFTAPPDWVAVGLVTTGRSHDLGVDRPGCAGQAPQPIRLTFLLARSGAACTLMTPIGPEHALRRMLDEPPIGLIPDACRRMLGLPTAPPGDGPELWLTARWLDQLLARIIEQPGSIPSWKVAAGLHPLVSGGDAPSPEVLAMLADGVSSEFDWERLRLMATQSQGADPAVTPAVAAWMDAGSFARHVLAAELPIDLLLSEVEALVPPAVMKAVRRALPAGCVEAKEPSRQASDPANTAQ